MRITARLEEASVQQILRELLPLTVLLDEEGGERWIRIDPARVVDFVPAEGLRVEVGGQLRWKTAGVPLLLTITSAQLLLRPRIQENEHGGSLVFVPALEKMDLKNIPDFVDSGIASMVNKRLAREGDKMSWHFGETLRSRFPVDRDLIDLESFDLSAGSGAVEVHTDAIVFTLDLGLHFTRRAATAAGAVADLEADPAKAAAGAANNDAAGVRGSEGPETLEGWDDGL